MQIQINTDIHIENTAALRERADVILNEELKHHRQLNGVLTSATSKLQE